MFNETVRALERISRVTRLTFQRIGEVLWVVVLLAIAICFGAPLGEHLFQSSAGRLVVFLLVWWITAGLLRGIFIVK